MLCELIVITAIVGLFVLTKFDLFCFIFLMTSCFASTVYLLWSRPIYYIIEKDEIITVCLFKRYHFLRVEIQGITLNIDIEYFLFGKDYIISSPNKVPHYCDQISKTRRTKRLIEKYYSSKLKE